MSRYSVTGLTAFSFHDRLSPQNAMHQTRHFGANTLTKQFHQTAPDLQSPCILASWQGTLPCDSVCKARIVITVIIAALQGSVCAF